MAIMTFSRTLVDISTCETVTRVAIFTRASEATNGVRACSLGMTIVSISSTLVYIRASFTVSGISIVTFAGEATLVI